MQIGSSFLHVLILTLKPPLVKLLAASLLKVIRPELLVDEKYEFEFYFLLLACSSLQIS